MGIVACSLALRLIQCRLLKTLQESIALFGKPYEEVHQWLDEFQGTEKYRMRHHKGFIADAGIKEAIRLFGEETGAVAKQHGIADLKEEAGLSAIRFREMKSIM